MPFHAHNNVSPHLDTLVAFANESALTIVYGIESEVSSNLVNMYERLLLWFEPNYLVLNYF